MGVSATVQSLAESGSMLAGFSADDRARMRATIIALVLATDLKQHFDILGDFQVIDDW